ncbi:hypothetical protein Ciccas_003695 [Cichlidogyrus casuarinus]|uniref:Uncharacterized protein n=1 Tax=Cichlidogyrus casuarinus TaxID=1844966 RepID=A0ABD2QDT8_9PLAT
MEEMEVQLEKKDKVVREEQEVQLEQVEKTVVREEQEVQVDKVKRQEVVVALTKDYKDAAMMQKLDPLY